MDKKTLDGIYGFMSKAYLGGWQYRFGDTPFMEKATKNGQKESILAHQWALMEFWFQFRRVCTELNKVVDSLKLYEIIMNHDLGETLRGDTPLVNQVSGSANKKQVSLLERDEIIKLTSQLQNKVGIEMISIFENYEKNSEEIDSIEILLARMLDYLEGHHFALTFGNNLSENSELIGKIVKARWAIYVQRLLDVLAEKDLHEAADEVKTLAAHHLQDMEEAGVKFEFEGFK